jgi:nucleotide-binding universal stress UspA family protein
VTAPSPRDRTVTTSARRGANKPSAIWMARAASSVPSLPADPDGVWKTIVQIADRHRAAAIVLGCSGPTGVRSLLHERMSSAVAQHADRPTLVIPARPGSRTAGRP